MIFRSFFLLWMIFGLSACQEQVSYETLVTNPRYLQQEQKKCESDASNPQCKIVKQAAFVLDMLSHEQMEAPEAFGERILHAQMKMADAKETLDDAKAHVIELHRKNANQQLQNDAQKVLGQAKTNYDDTVMEVNILLAALFSTSPTN
ncbi:MAG: hypothetical protein A3F12_07245 [Gammaproteobacteria bacterium RIFCSPHIGHO2_12_FULL_38_14]|nr:MAG: hypothetical protein A3F12_07245 [Gammaproteobacteria bacterium RIFCSPHIGHO2_12_FULL_38_14]